MGMIITCLVGVYFAAALFLALPLTQWPWGKLRWIGAPTLRTPYRYRPAIKKFFVQSGIIRIVLPDLNLGDILQLRKPHPCGGVEWKVTRLGADIGLECCTCQRRVLLARHELARRLKKVISHNNDELPTA
jgi:hypothetical protein